MSPACSVPGCPNPLGPGGAKGLCPRHYKAQRRGSPLQVEPRVSAPGQATQIVVRLSVELRHQLEVAAGPEYGEWVREAIRQRLKQQGPPPV